MNPTNPSRFDLAAAEWDANPARVDLARAVGAGILRAVPFQPAPRVLDYGAGTGLLTLCLQPHAASILAMDSSPGMLDALAKKLAAAGIANVQIRQWDLETEPFRDGGFDLVVSNVTFHHLRDVPRVLARLSDLLKPGGWIAAADLDTEDGSFHPDPTGVYHKGFAREQIAQWMAGTGLENVSVTSAHTLIKPDASGQKRAYGVFLAAGRKPVG